jgi:lysine 2,3-aminomutase
MPGKMTTPLLDRADSILLNIMKLDKVGISVPSRKLLQSLLNENPRLRNILEESENPAEVIENIYRWMMELIEKRPAVAIYRRGKAGIETFEKLDWRDYAIIRILDYIDHSGWEFPDPNLHGDTAVSNPFRILWLAAKKNTGGGNEDFFEDMLMMFRQLKGTLGSPSPNRDLLSEWMDRHPSGLDVDILEMRKLNRERILGIIINRMERGEISDQQFKFVPGITREQKFKQALEWWNDYHFHLRFAIRDPELLNEMLDFTLPPKTMSTLSDAMQVGIPIFVNPYYLTLINVHEPGFAVGADLAIRDYILCSKHLVKEFGRISAWEKEDQVEPGKPNAAGWLLPTYDCVHRRYPEVAILIPETMGRACGGLCVACQRMYDFQRGHLNFNLNRLKPEKPWSEKLPQLMQYFENDSQIRDILITGGDALMSSNRSLEKILDAVVDMARNKRRANRNRPEGEKFAEIVRVRLGTRIPAYLPQRITPGLIRVLSEFREKALTVGISQFVIQTHFETAMELTPETCRAIRMLIGAGWTITNQMVYTAAASRRGHAAKLRQVLNNIGILSYYTFTVKGYMENFHNFATTARAVQEKTEEKIFGLIPDVFHEDIREFPERAKGMVENIRELRAKADLPFLATDRNVLNLPGVGKSMTFRVIGITRWGRRILEFDHDSTRVHSPIIEKMGKVVIIESKSIRQYMQQLKEMGEDLDEYETVWGYSIGETEPREPVYEYPEYDFRITDLYTNLQLEG